MHRGHSLLRRGLITAAPVAALSAAACSMRVGAEPLFQQAKPTLDAIRAAGELKVGMTLQFKPEMFRDEATNQPMGYDVDLVQQMADDLQVKLTINDLPFDGLIPGLQANQFDLISVGLVNRPQRALSMWFSDPYVPYRQVLVVPSNSTASAERSQSARQADHRTHWLDGGGPGASTVPQRGYSGVGAAGCSAGGFFRAGRRHHHRGVPGQAVRQTESQCGQDSQS